MSRKGRSKAFDPATQEAFGSLSSADQEIIGFLGSLAYASGVMKKLMVEIYRPYPKKIGLR
jgi:hypothetical protein